MSGTGEIYYKYNISVSVSNQETRLSRVHALFHISVSLSSLIDNSSLLLFIMKAN